MFTNCISNVFIRFFLNYIYNRDNCWNSFISNFTVVITDSPLGLYEIVRLIIKMRVKLQYYAECDISRLRLNITNKYCCKRLMPTLYIRTLKREHFIVINFHLAIYYCYKCVYWSIGWLLLGWILYLYKVNSKLV